MIENKVQTGIISLIGNTPLIALEHFSKNFSFDVFGKLEMMNPGKSLKDRSSLKIIEDALDKGLINQKTTIIESTSGNMGIGLARLCAYLKIPLVLVVDPYINPQVLKILQLFKAKIVQVTQPDDKGGYLNTRLAKVKELLHNIKNSFTSNQYQNPNNPLSHTKTFDEIVETLGKAPDYMFVPTSTCGTLMGMAAQIKKGNYTTKLIAVDALGSVIFGTPPQKRQIPGMGASCPSHFLNRDLVPHVVHMSDKESIAGCYKLLDKESILAGGSAGAVVGAIEKFAPQIEKDATVVALICDDGERYLDTIYNEDWVSNILLKS